MLQSAAVRPGRSVYVEAAAFFAKSYTSRTGPARQYCRSPFRGVADLYEAGLHE